MASETLQNIRDSLEPGVQVRDLTARQAEVLAYILQCWMSGFLPTIREMCEQFDIRSPHGIVCHLNVLKAKGYLEESENAKSGLILADKAIELAIGK
jgi:repressor LexA